MRASEIRQLFHVNLTPTLLWNITPVFTNNMIYICKTDNETTNDSKLLARTINIQISKNYLCAVAE